MMQETMEWQQVVRCSHFTLGNPKKSFFSTHILQIIYVASEENK